MLNQAKETTNFKFPYKGAHQLTPKICSNWKKADIRILYVIDVISDFDIEYEELLVSRLDNNGRETSLFRLSMLGMEKYTLNWYNTKFSKSITLGSAIINYGIKNIGGVTDDNEIEEIQRASVARIHKFIDYINPNRICIIGNVGAYYLLDIDDLEYYYGHIFEFKGIKTSVILDIETMVEIDDSSPDDGYYDNDLFRLNH